MSGYGKWIVGVALVYLVLLPLPGMAGNLPVISDANYPIRKYSPEGFQQFGAATTTMTGTSVVTATVSGQVVTFTVQPPPAPTAPPFIMVNLNRVTMNAGQTVAGAAYTNRPNAAVNFWGGFRSEAKAVKLSGVTDGYGRFFGAVVIQLPGIYEIQGEIVADGKFSDVVVLTVYGLHLTVNPYTVARGSEITVDAFSGVGGQTLVLEARPAWNATWTNMGNFVTNQGGHYHAAATVPAAFPVGNYVLRLYDAATGTYSNEEWVQVT